MLSSVPRLASPAAAAYGQYLFVLAMFLLAPTSSLFLGARPDHPLTIFFLYYGLAVAIAGEFFLWKGFGKEHPTAQKIVLGALGVHALAALWPVLSRVIFFTGVTAILPHFLLERLFDSDGSGMVPLLTIAFGLIFLVQGSLAQAVSHQYRYGRLEMMAVLILGWGVLTLFTGGWKLSGVELLIMPAASLGILLIRGSVVAEIPEEERGVPPGGPIWRRVTAAQDLILGVALIPAVGYWLVNVIRWNGWWNLHADDGLMAVFAAVAWGAAGWFLYSGVTNILLGKRTWKGGFTYWGAGFAAGLVATLFLYREAAPRGGMISVTSTPVTGPAPGQGRDDEVKVIFAPSDAEPKPTGGAAKTSNDGPAPAAPAEPELRRPDDRAPQ